jgi:hypothetical protein
VQDAPPGNELVTARRDVLGVSLHDCLVLYDPRTERAHVLNASAARIWGMVQAGSTVAAITADLAASADTADEDVAAEVRETLARFTSERLIGESRDRLSQDTDRPADPRPLEGVGASDRPRSATLSILDRTVAFESESAEVVAAIDWLTTPLSTRESPGEVYEVDAAPERARVFPSRLNRIAAASSALAVLHAAAVVVGDVVVALPGAPQAGKSTLTTRLVSDGYGYLTDEVLGVAPQSLRVVGFPKRITLELGSWSLFPHLDPTRDRMTHDAFDPSRVRWVDPRSLHANALAWRGLSLELGIGVIARYQAGAECRYERLRPVDVVTELLANSFNLGTMGAAGLETLRGVATNVPFFRLTHGGVDAAAPAIGELLASEGLASPR